MTVHVAEHQRRRIRRATLVAASRSTFHGMTVEQIIAEAVVSRVTFYKLYDNKNAAFTDAVDTAVSDVKRKVSGQPDPLTALVAYACSEVEAARAILIELPAMNPELFDTYVDDAVELAGLEEPIGHMLVGGVAGILRNAVTYGTPVDLTGLEAFVRPYLDADAVSISA